MHRTWLHASLVLVLAVLLLAACTQASAPPAPATEKAASQPAEKPAQSAAAKPAEKAASKPAEQAPVKPAEKASARPTEKAGAKPEPKALPGTIAIGTHPAGTGYNATGAGIAKVASDHSPIKVIVKPFAGPNAWMPMLTSGELELGVINAIDAGWAYLGGPGYDRPNKNLRTVLRGHLLGNPVLIVRADSAIKNIKDLRGKRVTGEVGGNVVMMEILTASLESVGLTYDDVITVPVTDFATNVQALRLGRADAAFGGSPTTPAVLEADAAIGVRALNFGDIPPEQGDKAPQAMIDRLQKRLPGAVVYRQQKEGFMKTDGTFVGYPVMVAASVHLSADAVYELTKALYENDKELQPIHAWLRDWKQQTMFDPNPPAPYHEGAIRFWKEKGLWTSQAEANQSKLLSR
ncbi:MAG: TAXI family TRAP transporter solute-binding subunit [Chloroflexi bacterium]|nr:TAXI family TRAP transporter solute-binding subunit [Chloroflexota bacterium]